jgi:hypothetical protein
MRQREQFHCLLEGTPLQDVVVLFGEYRGCTLFDID